MKRVAGAVVRAVGGESVTVRVVAEQDATSDAMQLGLSPAVTEDVELRPVAVREKASGVEVLVADELLRKSGVTDARVWLEAAVGVAWEGRLMRVENVREESGVWVVELGSRQSVARAR